jgi:hypothetical protein
MNKKLPNHNTWQVVKVADLLHFAGYLPRTLTQLAHLGTSWHMFTFVAAV